MRTYRVGDSLKFTTDRVTTDGQTVQSSIKSGRIEKVIADDKGFAYVVRRKGKRELVLDVWVVT
ncbi:hypothetical protein ACVW05_002689 [Pseudomonas fulva]